MRTLILFFILFLSANVFPHELQFIGQHIKLNRQQESAWQSDVIGRATVNSNWELGFQGTYLERFDLYETRVGGLFKYRISPTLTFEARYLKGDSQVEILARDHYFLSLYHSLSQGISPFFIYQNALYSSTHVQSFRTGVEIEKIKQIILIPTLMFGQAQFKSPAEVSEVNSLGLRALYYEDLRYFFSVFAAKGIEAAQAVIGQSSQTVSTTTGGFSAGTWFYSKLKAEFIFDYTDYDELNNQFLTSTLNLVWGF